MGRPAQCQSPAGPAHSVVRWNLGSDVDPFLRMLQNPADEAFAVAIVIRQSRIDEVDAEFDGPQ